MASEAAAEHAQRRVQRPEPLPPPRASTSQLQPSPQATPCPSQAGVGAAPATPQRGASKPQEASAALSPAKTRKASASGGLEESRGPDPLHEACPWTRSKEQEVAKARKIMAKGQSLFVGDVDMTDATGRPEEPSPMQQQQQQPRQQKPPTPAAAPSRPTTPPERAAAAAAPGAGGPRIERATDALGRTRVVGTFRGRTMTSVAKSEVLAALDALGLGHLVVEVVGSAPTSKVVRLRLINWDAVTEATTALRTHSVTSSYAEGALWGQRGRTQEEAARVGPISRAVRQLKTLGDDEQRQGRTLPWTTEGAYRPGEQVGVSISYNHFET